MPAGLGMDTGRRSIARDDLRGCLVPMLDALDEFFQPITIDTQTAVAALRFREPCEQNRSSPLRMNLPGSIPGGDLGHPRDQAMNRAFDGMHGRLRGGLAGRPHGLLIFLAREPEGCDVEPFLLSEVAHDSLHFFAEWGRGRPVCDGDGRTPSNARRVPAEAPLRHWR